MGQNLSLSEPFKDTSAARLSAEDRQNCIIFGLFWLGMVYGLGMIWCAVTLLKRWAGKHGERGVNLFSVLAAFLLGTGWPLIMIYLALNN